MLKEISVVMLPTEKASKFYKNGNFSYPYFADKFLFKEGAIIFQHLYFLSNEKRKERDWTLNLFDNKITQVLNKDHATLANKMPKVKKIIATTDESLTLGTEDTFIYSLPTCSQSFIQKYIERYNAGNPIEKVMVEYEDVGGEEWMGNDYDGEPFWNEIIKLKLRGNEIIIHPVKDTFTREEVGKLLSEYGLDVLVARNNNESIPYWEEWFNSKYQ